MSTTTDPEGRNGKSTDDRCSDPDRPDGPHVLGRPVSAWLRAAGWPLWVWVLLAIIAATLRIELTVGAFSLAPGIALLSGSFLGPARGARSQALALLVVAPASLLLPGIGGPEDWAYGLGHVAAAAAAGVLAPAGREPTAHRRWVRWGLVAAAALALSTIATWNGPAAAPQLRFYYASALGMAVVITLYYAHRLLPHPGRVLGFLCGLLPYYAAGMAGALLLQLAGRLPAAVRVIGWALPDLLFYGYLSHLPGDLLAVVLVAYLTSAERRPEGLLLR